MASRPSRQLLTSEPHVVRTEHTDLPVAPEVRVEPRDPQAEAPSERCAPGMPVPHALAESEERQLGPVRGRGAVIDGLPQQPPDGEMPERVLAIASRVQLVVG